MEAVANAAQLAAAGEALSAIGGGPSPDGEAAFIEDWSNAVAIGDGGADDLGAGAQRTSSSVRFRDDNETSADPAAAPATSGNLGGRKSSVSSVRFSVPEDLVGDKADDAMHAPSSSGSTSGSRVRFESDSPPVARARTKSVGFADAPDYVDDGDAAAGASPEARSRPSLAERRARFAPADDAGNDSRAFRTGMSVYKRVANPELAVRLDGPATPVKNPKSPGILRPPSATGEQTGEAFFRDAGSPTASDGRSLSGSGRFGMRAGYSGLGLDF